MPRTYHTCKVKDCDVIKQQILNWANQFDICCFLDNQQYNSNYSSYEAVVGIGSHVEFNPSGDFFSSLDGFLSSNSDWIFSHFNYETRSLIEGRDLLQRTSSSAFPDFFLFVPRVVILLKADEITVGVFDDSARSILSEIFSQAVEAVSCPQVQFKPRFSMQEYLTSIVELKKHIMHGDCYEINFCQEFYSTHDIEPVSAYQELTRISPNPFSAFYRIHNNYLLCASPERYLKKTGQKIISQPIKGTAARDRADVLRDEKIKKCLETSSKDRSENVMIVDLVRNDLSRICKEGSVEVEEIFSVYSYPHVHQMISTVTGILPRDVTFSKVLKATFPMGSMTGAPKKKVMELIEQFEKGRRGIYSGTLGYFTPEKNFDFNVVIRSLVYNSSNKMLSFYVGSAITANSKAENEYEECLLKGKAIIDVFSGKQKAE